MGRHELREQVFMFLFRAEFHNAAEMPVQSRLFIEHSDEVLEEKDAAYIEERAAQILAKLSELDECINKNTEGWDTTRMGKVELAVLRVAAYEILFDESIPNGVAIDEAVEIAKKFGQENSGRFVNAILAKIMKQVE